MARKDIVKGAEVVAMPSILAYHPTITVWTPDGPYLVSFLVDDWIPNDELFKRVRAASGCKTWGELIERGVAKQKLSANGLKGYSAIRSDKESQLTAGADTPI